MQAHASSIYPEECCGLLLGVFEDSSKTKKVKESKQMSNVFQKEERYHRYTIDPKDFMSAESDAESRGLDIVGIYHSHPNAPAKPSLFDMSHAWPSLSYVVIEVRDSEPVETKSWLLKEDRSEFVQEEMKREG
jgi:proteasome lid subunit RPN8/RPN11